MGERDSGKFNYHLGKLTGHFVTKDDNGYRLSLAGNQMYGAIQSGAYTANASLDPFEFEGPCPLCGSDVLVAEYADEKAKLYCPNCAEWRNEFSFPPASLDQYTRNELPYAFDRWMRATVVLFSLAAVPAGATNVVGATLVQRLVPDDLLGRVSAASGSASTAIMPLGALIGGVAGDAFGATAVMYLGGIGMDWIVLYVLSVPSLRNMPAASEAEPYERPGLRGL